tara:strand:+ start:3456 stop:3716 length:261 start_codon:yes stop_codon:yes gene_type:complete
MSRKQIRKVHVDDKEYVYTIKKGYEATSVNIYESGNKSSVFMRTSFDEYTQVTPSMIKDEIVKELCTQIINEEIIKKLNGENNDLL